MGTTRDWLGLALGLTILGIGGTPATAAAAAQDDPLAFDLVVPERPFAFLPAALPDAAGTATVTAGDGVDELALELAGLPAGAAYNLFLAESGAPVGAIQYLAKLEADDGGAAEITLEMAVLDAFALRGVASDGMLDPAATNETRVDLDHLVVWPKDPAATADLFADQGQDPVATLFDVDGEAGPAVLTTALGDAPGPLAVEAAAASSTGYDPAAVTIVESQTPALGAFLTDREGMTLYRTDLAPETWRLAVTGLVDAPLDLGLADLRALPQRTVTMFLECSGDSRGRFVPQAEGTQWDNTAIGNAVWTGVPLVEVLNRAGVRPGAVDVVCQGADFAEMQRGLPLDVARNPDTMLVWQMNGQPLPTPNGGPVRLLVPGWGGIASTKWIVGLDLIDRPFTGTFNSESYVIVTEAGHVTRPVTVMPPKSVITSPRPGPGLPVGLQTVAGYAWSGYGGIVRVEISTDGGATWADAPIVLEAGRLSWVRFEFPWQAVAGAALLRSRAHDERGLTQPDAAEWNAKGYLMNAVYEVPVTVS